MANRRAAQRRNSAGIQTRRGTDKISQWLTEHGQTVCVLHSDLKQRDRSKALEDFKAGNVKILCATDVASRGLDISNVTHVINYDVPQHSEDYVHRIGRTGRAESEGDAFTILTADELDFAKSVENFVEKKIERRKLESFEYTYTALLDESPARPVRKKRRPAPRRRRK